MILKKFGCEQFAGITDREYELDEHMNVIVGANESGKTTMIDLIYHVLNTDVDLKRNEKKEFFDTYMPARRVDGFSGDSIDGRVMFGSESGDYTITKEWSLEEDGSCRLKKVGGAVIKSKKNVQETMRAELEFGQAVYRNLVFSSQREKERILKGILQSAEDNGVKEAKGELASRVTQAVMELDGVSIEELGEKIGERIAEYENNWDSGMDRPKRKSKAGGGRWEKNVGKILQSYYDMTDKEREKEQAKEAEYAYEQAEKEFEEAKEQLFRAEQELKEYLKYQQDIDSRKTKEELSGTYENDLKECVNAKKKWPETSEKYETITRLKSELEVAKTFSLAKERYEKLEEYEKKIEDLRVKLKDAHDIPKEEYDRALLCANELGRMKASIKGMAELKGKIEVRPDLLVKIRQGADNRPVNVEGGEFEVDEPFRVEIPEVMHLELSPKDVDMDIVRVEYERRAEEQKAILASYGILEMEMLKDEYERCEEIRSEIRSMEAALGEFIGEQTEEEIEQAYTEACAGVSRGVSEIEQDICGIGGEDFVAGHEDEMIGSLRAELRVLKEKYSSPEDLEQRICGLQEKLQAIRAEIRKLQQIPEKYMQIEDAGQAEKDFREKQEEAETIKRQKETAFIQCEKNLPDRTFEEIELEYKYAGEEFEKNKELCSHWKHIQSVFEKTRESMEKSPSADILENTERYLETLTGGRVKVRTDEDNLDLGVISNGNIINYRLLSEGTKETVSLAFRLAVLENLYGDRSGFAVFDDTLIDMDPVRRKVAAELLKKFSEKYQVIYVTCDPAFGEMLGGNVIQV